MSLPLQIALKNPKQPGLCAFTPLLQTGEGSINATKTDGIEKPIDMDHFGVTVSPIWDTSKITTAVSS